MTWWNNLPKPYLAVAPMADVTDIAFRTLFVQYGKPDVVWTEFVSADGLFLARHNPSWKPLPNIPRVQEIAEICYRNGVAKDHPLILDLVYYDTERPIVVQFFSTDPDRMRSAAKLGRELGYDGIDLNMGCPADVICSQGAGAAMIKTPERAREVIRAAKEGAENVPVSVKTRIGYHAPDLEPWVTNLLSCNIDALTIHARTRKDMSRVPARWEFVKQTVSIRDSLGYSTSIIGNGDVVSVADGLSKCSEYGSDGAMVGRGIFGNPWFFTSHIPTQPERLQALREHGDLFNDYLGNHKSFALMKKHVKAYIQGFDGAKEVREALMETEDHTSFTKVIEHFM